VAHALVEANEKVQTLLPSLPMDVVWARPGGAASIGFHASHAIGSLDRLLTYARGEALSESQLAALDGEKSLGPDGRTPRDMAAHFAAAVERALVQLRSTSEADLLAKREVGRAKLLSNVIGLLTHAAEHTATHVGQMVTTAKILA
jgi:hypothetical protein